MKNHRITLLGTLDSELQEWLCGHPAGHERGAFILFRRLSRLVENQQKSIRLLAVDLVKMTDDWVIESSQTHLRINMRKLPDIYVRCEREGFGTVFTEPALPT